VTKVRVAKRLVGQSPATREQVADGLATLLDLPVEVVLATHGGPTDRAALGGGLGGATGGLVGGLTAAGKIVLIP
jgi:hypothetical protein